MLQNHPAHGESRLPRTNRTPPCSAAVLLCLRTASADLAVLCFRACSADLRLCIDRCRFLCIEYCSERFGRSDTTERTDSDGSFYAIHVCHRSHIRMEGERCRTWIRQKNTHTRCSCAQSKKRALWQPRSIGFVCFFILFSFQYLAFLLLITIILFSLGIAISVEKSKAGEYIAKAWYRAPSDLKNSIQIELGCCGLQYWNDSAVWPCPASANSAGGAYCYPDLVSAFERAYTHAGGTGIAFSVFMGVGIGLVVCLIQGIQRRNHEGNMQQKQSEVNADGIVVDDSSLVDIADIDAGAASMFDRAEPQEQPDAAAAAAATGRQQQRRPGGGGQRR